MILFKWNLASQNPQIFPFSIQFRDGTKNFYEIVKKIPCFLPTWSPFLSYLCCMTNAKLVFMKNKTLWKSQEILCVHLHIMQYLYSGLENKKMCNLWKLFNSKGKVWSLRHTFIRYTFSSNHYIHQSSCGLCFWVPDPLIDRF